jgi:YaiO family outer membrane protein
MKFGFVGAVVLSAATLFGQVEEPVNPRDQLPPMSVGVDYEYENFGSGQDDLDAWHMLSAELGRRFSGGSIIGRVNWAERFNQTGLQYEVDAYPRLGKGMYAYLNAGVSSDDIFPDRRFGAQLYRSVGNGFELSIGGRLLQFDDTDVVIYTGSIGRYWGNYYLTFRPTFADSDTRNDMSSSGAVLFRRYYATGDDYIGFRGNFGRVPETDILLQQEVDLESWGARIERQRGFGNLLLRGFIGYRQQEMLQESD